MNVILKVAAGSQLTRVNPAAELEEDFKCGERLPMRAAMPPSSGRRRRAQPLSKVKVCACSRRLC
jgi:hypothetical protein